MPEREPKRLRFGPEDDMALLKEFINLNPLEDPEKWETIQSNIHVITRKKFLIRTLKDHLFRLLEMWLKKDKGNQIMSGVEEIFCERDQLLQEVSDLCNNANVKPITKKRKISKEKQIQELGISARDECARTLSLNQKNVWTERQNNENAPSSSCDHDYYLIPTVENEVEISNDETTNHVEIEPLEATAQKSSILNSGVELPPIPEPMPHNEKIILGPKRTKLNKSGPLRRSALEYLQAKEAREEVLKSRQLHLEEEKLNLEKKRIDLEQQRQEFEIMERKDRHDMEKIRFNHEIFERDQKTKIIEQQQQLIQSLLERLRKYENQ